MKQSRGPWIRIYDCNRRILFFGRTRENRFDAPNNEYGTLYVGQDEACAFVEVFGDPLNLRLVSIRDLRNRCYGRISAKRSLKLVDLTGRGLRQIGADTRLTSGDDYDLSRRWALRIWSNQTQPDGIMYSTRHDPSKSAVAIFDRMKGAIKGTRIGKVTDDETLLAQILDAYGFALDE